MCNAIGQMAADFAPTFQKKFHDKIVPAILLLLEDNLNPRVQAHAGKLYTYKKMLNFKCSNVIINYKLKYTKLVKNIILIQMILF